MGKKLGKKNLLTVVKAATEKLDGVVTLLEQMLREAPYFDSYVIDKEIESIGMFFKLLENTELSTLEAYEFEKANVHNVLVNGIPIEKTGFTVSAIRVISGDFSLFQYFGSKLEGVRNSIEMKFDEIEPLFRGQPTTQVLMRVWCDSDVRLVRRLPIDEDGDE